MAIAGNGVEVISGNSTGKWLVLFPGPNSVSVSSPSWDGDKTATLEQSDSDDELTKSPLKIDGTQVSMKSNDRIIVFGPGLVRATIASYDGTAVTVSVRKSY